ncbi:helix-turn-helix domain-containing protein [Nocardia sp. NPDC050713]|uniref:TetR/AcrR family transcriptional regulator n=1 Tax=Nocardia sp. NPDC050713 TaxID=3154511 RepID=UPI00340920A8
MAAAPSTVTPAETRILDAALDQFVEVGIKKTTTEDIARRVGLDRATVYRRVGSRDDIVNAVFNREVARVMSDLTALPDRHDNLDDLVADLFVTVVTHWRTHPLVNRLLTLEPERVVLALTINSAGTFPMSIATTETMLRAAVSAGLLADHDDLTARAETVCRLAHSVLLAPHGRIPLDTEEQLRDYALRHLVPIIAR